MARWEPNASERLAVAALELFAERGYENTTVIDIAQRAGLTKSTFFRHFQDKREVLFGDGSMNGLLAEAIAAAPATAARSRAPVSDDAPMTRCRVAAACCVCPSWLYIWARSMVASTFAAPSGYRWLAASSCATAAA